MKKHITLVKKIVTKYAIRGVELDDLVQEGLIGLQEAHLRYDPTRNAKFETYATFWIKKRALEFLKLELRERHKKQLLIPLIETEAEHPLDTAEGEIPLYLALMELTEDDRFLMYLRFGFGDLEPRTYETLGLEFGKSREWARKKVKVVLAKLKRKLQ